MHLHYSYIVDNFGIRKGSSRAMLKNGNRLMFFVPNSKLVSHTNLTYLVVKQDLSV